MYPIGYDSDVAEKTAREAARRVIAENRKARHDYHVIETFESGVALLGTEVKAIREGRVNLRDSYARVECEQVGGARLTGRRARRSRRDSDDLDVQGSRSNRCWADRRL